MRQFAYYTVVYESGGFFGGKLDPHEFDATLNELGNDGWELVSVTASNEAQGRTRAFVCVFKRELQ